MSGWRDTEGRTASERRKADGQAAAARLAATVRHRPLSLVKPILGALLVAVIIVAVVLALT